MKNVFAEDWRTQCQIIGEVDSDGSFDSIATQLEGLSDTGPVKGSHRETKVSVRMAC